MLIGIERRADFDVRVDGILNFVLCRAEKWEGLRLSAPQLRTVKAHRSYGYDMETPDGKVSRLDFQAGQIVEAYSHRSDNL